MTRLRRAKTPSYRWVIVSTLSVTQTISWGILYYAFGILRAPMEREMGWSRAESTAAFSIAPLVSAICAVPAGRWVDRGVACLMMTLGSCAGAALLVAWARVESLPALYLIRAAVGARMAAVLHEPAFAVLAKWFGHDRERGFTILTLTAGLASTIFNPIASFLAASLGWRQAVLVLAAILGATTIPMHAILRRGGPVDEGPPAREATTAGPRSCSGTDGFRRSPGRKRSSGCSQVDSRTSWTRSPTTTSATWPSPIYTFSATTRRRSANWDEYDRIAEADKRVAMVLRPAHVYGTALAGMREALKTWRR